MQLWRNWLQGLTVVTETMKKKILDDNSRRLYGLYEINTKNAKPVEMGNLWCFSRAVSNITPAPPMLCTLYDWKSRLSKGAENPEALNDQSRAPRTKRKRLWPKEVIEEIRRLRTMHPNLGKEKLYPFVKVFCDQTKLKCPQPRTIGRLIADQPDKMRFKKSSFCPSPCDSHCFPIQVDRSTMITKNLA